MASFPTARLLPVFLLVLLASFGASAQVAPSVTGQETHLWAGGEASRFQSDFHNDPTLFLPDNGNYQLDGIGAYADLGVHGRFSLEGEARFLVFNSMNGETEKTFLIGPSARVYRRGHLVLNAKFLGGAGLINFPFKLGYGSYFAFAPAGNLEYRLSSRLKARAEYEYIFQPSAPGLPGFPGAVDPHGFSLGLAYRVF